ncbi:hypothetical protein QBC35DRAFT_390507 [Podospora australis]|uniref:Uncharacterized protein n=1 Tax=Podospora australis TaxID=1536484 RepID=A0AAN7AFR9_9PEZI|nr:hypothetical protein QBC35DRAFT_390507 [Podospora australis]
MILLGLIGLLGALGHHLYNDSLSGSPVVNAQWPQRWGVALAFFVKMTLVGSVQMAFKQRAWLTVKKRSFRVKTLDSIFHSCQDPAGFFNKELFTGAFFPALMALLVWILPLSAIASPSTLTATNGLQTSPTTCHNVSTLDFSRENGFGIWRRDPNVNKQGMSFWDEWIRPKTAFYNSPSMDNVRLFRLSMLSNTPLQPPNPCPTDSNCTFAVSFAAPSYKCGKRNDFGGEHRPYNLSQMAPLGDLLYASYSSLDLDEDFVGRPKSWDRSNVTVETGVFKQEPTLWVSWVWNTTLPATSENEAQWDTSYWRTQLKTSIIECTLWNSTYEYTLQFLQGQMNVSDKRVTQDRLLLPAGQVMSPDNPVYMEFAGFHATAFLYRSQLAGNASQKGQDSWVMTESDIFQTEILDPGSGQSPEEDLASRIEAAFHNIYLSFLSNEKQISQVFASRSCEVSSHVLVWHYTPTWLAVSYIIACALTFVAMGVGLHAIVQNGYVAETNFSTFLVTTRNPDLDKMARGSCLGALPVDKEVTKTKLRFGKTVSNEEGGDGDASQATHAAFGFDDRVVELQRGKNYS